jgi:hypothetical protein
MLCVSCIKKIEDYYIKREKSKEVRKEKVKKEPIFCQICNDVFNSKICTQKCTSHDINNYLYFDKKWKLSTKGSKRLISN